MAYNTTSTSNPGGPKLDRASGSGPGPGNDTGNAEGPASPTTVLTREPDLMTGTNVTNLPKGRDQLQQELSGLDSLVAPKPTATGHHRRITKLWQATWPKLAAIAFVLTAWQLVVWSGWRPTYVFPGPTEVFSEFWNQILTLDMAKAVGHTLQRAALGFTLAVAVGTVLGLAVSRSRIIRTAFGSLLTGLQSMPSIAWFPLAILFFQLSESAILFVVVLGAAPSVANGLITGVDHTPPLLLNAGKVLGAKGLKALRHVVIPAALPGYVGGLKQGWAFAWRSLMAGELLVIIASKPSIGVRLQFAREMSDASGLMVMMIVILMIGILVDSLVFGTVERSVRRRRGLIDTI